MRPKFVILPILLLISASTPSSALFAQDATPAPVMPLPPLSASVTVRGLPAAPTAVSIPSGRQVFYNLQALSWQDAEAGIRQKVITGEGVSIALVEYGPQRDRIERRTGTFEQVILQMAGSAVMRANGREATLDSMGIAILPANTAYTIETAGSEPFLTLEFATSPDGMKIPGVDTDRPETKEVYREIFMDFAGLSWIRRSNGVQYKIALGDSCSFMLWHIPAEAMYGVDRPGHRHTAEQISVVLQGRAKMRIGDQIMDAGPGTILMIPSDVDHLPMTPIEREGVLLLDFQPIIRHDMVTEKR